MVRTSGPRRGCLVVRRYPAPIPGSWTKGGRTHRDVCLDTHGESLRPTWVVVVGEREPQGGS